MNRSSAKITGRSAVLSDDRLYRYSLTREWGNGWRGRVCWIMLNPSTADAEVDDPTIRRCIGFSYREGFSSLVVVNRFSLRATNPRDLVDSARSGIDPFGPGNAEAVEWAVAHSQFVVAAWGAHSTAGSPVDVVRLARRHARPLVCLGTTKDGSPLHPLYIRGDQPFERWPL